MRRSTGIVLATICALSSIGCGLFRSTDSVVVERDASIDSGSGTSAPVDAENADAPSSSEDFAVEFGGDGDDRPTCSSGCGPRARCVDGTCVCEPFSERQEGECVSIDPCASGTCYHVDSVDGADGNPGTADAPLQTLDAVESKVLPELQPGDAVLFRRGRSWDVRRLVLADAPRGTADLPIFVGAYGPTGEPPPRVQVFIDGAHHVIIRDLSGFSVDGVSPCFEFDGGSRNVTLVDNESEGGSHSVRVEDAQWIVVFRNTFASSTQFGVRIESKNDNHFWVARNTVREPEDDGLQVFGGTEGRDYKFVDNVVIGVGGDAVSTHAPFTWIVNNTVLGWKSNGILMPTGRNQRAVGNLAIGPQNAVASSAATQVVAHNTLVTTDGPTVRLSDAAVDTTLLHNLYVTTSDTGVFVAPLLDPEAAVAASNHNWFTPEAACAVRRKGDRVPIPWDGFDTESGCGPVNDLDVPAGPPEEQTPDESLFERFVPGEAWEGCNLNGSPTGAFDCTGRRTGTIEPFDGLVENGGLGWEGDELMRFHYPMR